MKFCRITLALIYFTISLVMAFAATNNGYAEGVNLSPRYSYIASIRADLTIDSSGNAKCKGVVETYSSKSIVMTVTLMVKNDGSWKTVKVWTNSVGNSDYMKSTYNYNVQPGIYKITIRCVVTNTDGRVETGYAVSKEIGY